MYTRLLLPELRKDNRREPREDNRRKLFYITFVLQFV